MRRQSGVVAGFFDEILRPGPLVVKPHHRRDRLGEIGHKHAVGVSAGFKQYLVGFRLLFITQRDKAAGMGYLVDSSSHNMLWLGA